MHCGIQRCVSLAATVVGVLIVVDFRLCLWFLAHLRMQPTASYFATLYPATFQPSTLHPAALHPAAFQRSTPQPATFYPCNLLPCGLLPSNRLPCNLLPCNPATSYPQHIPDDVTLTHWTGSIMGFVAFPEQASGSHITWLGSCTLWRVWVKYIDPLSLKCLPRKRPAKAHIINQNGSQATSGFEFVSFLLSDPNNQGAGAGCPNQHT